MDPIRADGEFTIEGHSRGIQRHPELAAVQGGFVAAWTDDAVPICEVGGPDVRAKVFNWTGDTIIREFLVNNETIDHQRDPKIAGTADGGYVVVWQDFSGRGGDDCGGGIKAKIFDGRHRLVRDEFLVNSETQDQQFNAYVATLAGGGFVVTWQAGHGSAARVKARLFSAEGDPLATEFLVSDDSDGREDHPMVASLAGGGFVIAWTDARPIGAHSRRSAKATLFAADGSEMHALFEQHLLTNKDHFPAAIAGLSGGGFVIAWAESPVSNAEHGPANVAIFSAGGELLAEQFEICTEALNAPHSISLAPRPEGGFIAAWTASSAGGLTPVTVRAQVYGPRGEPEGSQMLMGNGRGQRNPAVLALDGAQFLVAWEEMQPADHVCVKARRFELTRRMV